MIFLILTIWFQSAYAAEDVQNLCQKNFSGFEKASAFTDTAEICKQAKVLEDCESENGIPIYHFDKVGTEKTPKKILALSLIHGDELPSGTVTRQWLSRLSKIDPRNSWRVIPVVNPDGWAAKTRTNARKVDINRNFPTDDWEKTALHLWKTNLKSDPRRYPGPTPASEKETNCLMKHFTDFKPDFIISVHTPLGVLDFDGPKVNFPAFKPLPWISLGNYPGSLGRFMWRDQKVPVLTIELKGSTGVTKLEEFDKLQDITGTVAIQADQVIKKEKK